MKSEKELIDRMNNAERNIPINRKSSDQETNVDNGTEVVGDAEDPCLNCDQLDCPSNPNYHELDDVPPKKVSEEEKAEIKELIEKSKALFKGAATKVKDKWDQFQTDNNIRDEDLIRRWREYKEKVEKWIDEHKKFPRQIAEAMLLDEYDEDKKKVAELPWNERTFKEIVDQMFDLYQRKNADYGDSFAKSFKKFGMQSALMRLTDKYNRLETLTEKQDQKVKDESIEDTLLDIANYAILTLIELKRK